MGLLSLLLAVVILALVLIFYHPSFSPFTPPPQNPKQIENSAQDAVNTNLERSRLEQNQIKDLQQ